MCIWIFTAFENLEQMFNDICGHTRVHMTFPGIEFFLQNNSHVIGISLQQRFTHVKSALLDKWIISVLELHINNSTKYDRGLFKKLAIMITLIKGLVCFVWCLGVCPNPSS